MLEPGQRHAVATGFAIAIPEGHEVQVRPRSGLALKHGITCLNTPGTIDHDYRGEVKVILANLGSEPFAVRRGERIAQLVPAPVLKARFARSRRWEKPSAARADSGARASDDHPPHDFVGRGTGEAGGGVLGARRTPPPPSAVPLPSKSWG